MLEIDLQKWYEGVHINYPQRVESNNKNEFYTLRFEQFDNTDEEFSVFIEPKF